MDAFKQRIAYKNVPVNICFKTLTQREQYECIRILLAHRTQNVTICKHGNSNTYINTLIAGLPHAGFQCTDSCNE